MDAEMLLGYGHVEYVANPRATAILAELDDEAETPVDISLPSRLVAACAAAIPVTGVGLVVMTDSGPGAMLASTDGPARIMEELQFTLVEGPCVDASRSSRPVLQPDLATTGPSRWPGFAPGALDAGIRAIFALPLQVGGIRVGVLDLYRDKPGSLSDNQLAEGLAFADAATTVMLQMQAETADNSFASIIEHRAEVHQATGIIAVQSNVGLADALMLLRAHSFATERPILEVAHDVVSRTLRFDLDESAHE